MEETVESRIESRIEYIEKKEKLHFEMLSNKIHKLEAKQKGCHCSEGLSKNSKLENFKVIRADHIYSKNQAKIVKHLLKSMEAMSGNGHYQWCQQHIDNILKIRILRKDEKV